MNKMRRRPQLEQAEQDVSRLEHLRRPYAEWLSMTEEEREAYRDEVEVPLRAAEDRLYDLWKALQDVPTGRL